MAIGRRDTLPIRTGEDVVRVRHVVRQYATELRLSLVDQTKVVTAASELARNTLDHGGGGAVNIEVVSANGRQGIRLVFEDKGPGIANLQLALKEGYTTGGGLGLGLPGAKKLSNEFEVESKVGEGTRVTMVRWK
jgi:serine/threonine-protein kinase RsbT